MPLQRLHFATSVMDDFLSLHSGQQRIFVFLISQRSMRKPPLKPSNYFSYKDIAEGTGLKIESVRLYLLSLKKLGWIQEVNRQLAEGKLRFRFTFPKSDLAWEATYADETEHEFDSYEAEAEANGWLLIDDTFWRVGENGYQSRGVKKRFWAERVNPPDFVVNFFSDPDFNSDLEPAEGFTL